jgi:uncharacterized protein YoxC
MTLLLTILSVLAVWAFLTVLIIGLLLILKPLESIRAFLEKITMGVRAIEHQTAPLGARTDTLTGSLQEAERTVRASADRLASAERNLERAAPALRPR